MAAEFKEKDKPCWQLPRYRVIHPTHSAPLPARLKGHETPALVLGETVR